jgi:hypothetical protein
MSAKMDDSLIRAKNPDDDEEVLHGTSSRLFKSLRIDVQAVA